MTPSTPGFLKGVFNASQKTKNNNNINGNQNGYKNQLDNRGRMIFIVFSRESKRYF